MEAGFNDEGLADGQTSPLICVRLQIQFSTSQEKHMHTYTSVRKCDYFKKSFIK